MKTPGKSPLAEFLRASSWQAVLAAAFLYALGVGIVVFRGDFVNWTNFWLGLMVVILLLLSSFYLTEFFNRMQNPRARRRDNANHKPEDGQVVLSRTTFLLAAITTLTAGAMITAVLFTAGALNPSVGLVLGLALLLAFIYAVPPFRLVHSGYGELILTILLTNLIPALGFLLQTGEMSNLLGMLTFPLTALFLAMLLATSLETYYADIKAGKVNLMIRLGWQRGMAFHNLLILAAYLLVGIGSIVGMAWALTWPKLLTLPIGLFQVWQIWQISRGAKPRWNILKITAYATFAITLYLQTYTLWVG